MSLPQPVEVEPLDKTYSDHYLAVTEAVQPGAELGWAGRDPNRARHWQYMESVDSDLRHGGPPLEVTPVSAYQPSVTTSPVAGMPDRSEKWAERTGPILDQAMTPHCVTHSGASYRVLDERKEHRRTYTPEPHDWYHRTKQHPNEPWPGQDGTGIPYAADVARTQGVLMDDPRSKKDDPGRMFKIRAYAELTSVEQILEALHRRGPVWFGIDVDRGIFRPNQIVGGPAHGKFVIDPPGVNTLIGGHAMLIVGWWLSQGWFLVQNSWGEDYGDEGYFFMPVTHFTHSDYWWDAWVVDDEKDVFIHRPQRP